MSSAWLPFLYILIDASLLIEWLFVYARYGACERENVTPVACLTVSRLAVLDNNVCRGGRLSVSLSTFSSYNLLTRDPGRGTGDTQPTHWHDRWDLCSLSLL